MGESPSKDYIRIAIKYARNVVSKKIIACKWTRLAAQRFLNDLERAKSKACPFYFSAWWAADACDFIEKLPHVEGEWDPPTLILEPWQIFICVNVFGFRRQVGKVRNEEKDPRRFNTVYIELARKNGKSAFTSGVALYCLTCEGENGPQIKTAATTGDQARIVFDVAKKMADKTPDLCEAFQVETFANSIACMANGGHIKPINSKASTQDGLNPHLTIIDELHAHKDRSLFDVLKSARGARKNPLSWYITTAGYNAVGVCYEQRTLLTKILQNVIPGDHYFGIIYTIDVKDPDFGIPADDDPYDERNWFKANPNLNVSVQISELRGYAEEARNSPASEGEFKTKRLNVWLNAANAWLNMRQWDLCEDTSLRIEDFEGCDCWIGVDLSERRDVTGIVILFMKDDEPYVFPRFYLPKELVDELAHKTHTHYKAWADMGLFTLTPGDYIDVDYIEEDLKRDYGKYNPKEIVFDQRDNPTLFNHLANDGIEAIQLLKNVQNFSDPSKELEALIQARRFHHDGNPVLKWMASNCVVERRIDGSILPKKEHKDSDNKIDGIDCVISGLARAMLGEANEIQEGVLEL